MKKTLFFLLILICATTNAQVKIGNNPTTIGTSSLLELESTNKGLLLPRVANTAAVTAPVNGMMIYDLSSTCTKIYENGAWSICLSTGAPAGPTAINDCNLNGFEGTYTAGFAMVAANKFTVLVTNNSFTTATIAFQNSDLALSGIAGLTVSATSPASSTLIAGASVTVTYTISGTPTAGGTLTGTWNKLNLSCVKTKTVNSLSASFASNYCTGAALNGAYVSGMAFTGSNTFTVSITNTSGATLTPMPAPTVGNLTLSYTGAGTLTVSSVSPNANFSIANGATQVFTYTLAGTPTSPGELTATWNYVDFNCVKTKTIGGLSSAFASNYCAGTTFNGQMVSGVAFTGTNTFTVSITNTSGATISPMPAPAVGNLALSYTGSGSLTVSAVSPSTTFSIANGATQIFTYTLAGTPSTVGTLTATWNYADFNCLKTKYIGLGDAVFTLAKNNKYIFSVNDLVLPLNNQGTLAIGSTVNVPYTSGLGSYLAYSSPTTPIAAAFCEDGASDWTFEYNYSAGTFSATGNVVVNIVTKKAGVVTAWDAKRVSNITTINFNCVNLPWVSNTNIYSNTVGLDEGGDAIRGSLSTSGATYDAATVDNTVLITQAEYNNMMTIVPGAVKKGVPTVTTGTGFGAQTLLATTTSGVYTALGSNEYVAGVAISPPYNYSSATNFRILVSAGNGTAITCLNTTTPNISGWVIGTYSYFAIKRPSVNSGTGKTHLGDTWNLTSDQSAHENSTGPAGSLYYLGSGTYVCGTGYTGTSYTYSPALQVICTNQKSW